MIPLSIALSLVAIKVEARSNTPLLSPPPEFLCLEKCPGFPGGATDECGAKCLKISVEEFKAQKFPPPEVPEEFLCAEKCPGFPGGETDECVAKCLKISVEEFKALKAIYPPPGFGRDWNKGATCLATCPGFSEKAETPECGSKCVGVSVAQYKAMPPLHSIVCLNKCPKLSDGNGTAPPSPTPECSAKCMEILPTPKPPTPKPLPKMSVGEFRAQKDAPAPHRFERDWKKDATCLEKCPGFSEKAETPECGSKCVGLSVEDYKAESFLPHFMVCLNKCPTRSDGFPTKDCADKCFGVPVEKFGSLPKLITPKPIASTRSSSDYVKRTYSALVKADVFQGDYKESRQESPDSMHSASHKLFAPLSILTILPFA